MSEKLILGIDPGTNVMGYAVLKVIGNKAELVVMGVIDMRKESDPYLRLGRIFERVTGIIDEFLPDEMAIEAPFFGKNVQSMLKLGRAQGVAIAAAIEREVPIRMERAEKVNRHALDFTIEIPRRLVRLGDHLHIQPRRLLRKRMVQHPAARMLLNAALLRMVRRNRNIAKMDDFHTDSIR
mgnify:CR=1 FL=1